MNDPIQMEFIFAAVGLIVRGASLAEALLLETIADADRKMARAELAYLVALAQAIERARERGPMSRFEMDGIGARNVR